MQVTRDENRAGVLALPAVALIGGVLIFCGAFYLREAGFIRKSLLDVESGRVSSFAQIFQHQLKGVSDDLRGLASGDALRAYVANGQPDDLERAVQRAAFYSRMKPEFDQIRYLDERGREVFRVNRNGRVVASGELQDKSDRPYFQKSFALARGQIYLSAFDLNVENGRVEQPPKPVLRFATPVFDDAGGRRGVYVINYLGDSLFANLESLRPEVAHRLRVLNARGYWLRAAIPEQEWGFMYPERGALALAGAEPELWKRMTGITRGHAPYAGGILVWQRIDMRQGLANGPNSAVADDDFLVIASEVSRQEYGNYFTNLRIVFGVLTALLCGSAIITARFFRSRRQAWQALRRSEENLSVTLHSIGDAMLATDVRRRITRLNPVAEKLTGWTLAEAAGRPVDEVFRIINEETRKPAVIPVDAVLASGEIHGLANHTVLIARDGTERPIADSAAPIRDTDGRILGAVLIFRDMTAEKAAQRAVEESEAQLDRFFTLSLDFLVIANVDGYFKRVSPAVFNILGWSVEEFLARPFIEFVHPDDRAATLAEVERQMVAGEKVLQFENRYQHKNGSWRVLSWRSAPQPDGFMYATARDVTEKNEAALALQRAHADLTHANTELSRASRLKDEFLASMSHELRTPLNGILGMNELLLGTELNARQKQYVEAASSSSKLLAQLISDVLDLSKIESGKLELDPRECDMEALVYDVADMMLQTARQKGLALRCRLAPDVCVIGFCDDNRLRQVLMNLVNNAIKFTSAGSVTINGARMTQPDGSARLRFSVADTGIGIPADRRDRLFRAFSQVDSSITRQFGGTGLGLSICRQLVELMGGEIGVETKVGAGSTFWFEVPIKIVSENSGWERKRRLLAGTRFIAVDGLDQERRQIADCLRSWGCPFEQVATCTQAMEAIARAIEAQTPFKIVLADYRLVRGDEHAGFERLTAIPDVYVIGLGAPPDDASTNYLYSLGVRHVLTDPVRPSSLLDAISSVLSVRDGSEPHDEDHAGPPRSPAVVIAGHVLVAEDNRINQIYIVDLLKEFGCTVDLVVNGEEALAAVERRPYDLVLMDCQMPEMDGFTATREIRRREAAQSLSGRRPILALTANALKGDRERCLEAGMDDYISKPVEGARLRSLLEKFLVQPPASQ